MVHGLPQAFREVHAKTWHLFWSIAWENIGTVPAKHCNPWVHFSYGGFHTTVFMILRFSCFIWKEIYVTAYYTSSRCLSSSKREVEWKYRKNMWHRWTGLYLLVIVLTGLQQVLLLEMVPFTARSLLVSASPSFTSPVIETVTPSSSPQSVCWANLS